MQMKKTHSSRRRGSVYLYVLATSILITVIGLGALMASRIQMHSARLTRDYAEARTCAVSAVEWGLLCVQQDPNWRQTRPNGIWIQDQPLGSSRFTLEGVDPGDSQLNDSEYEPLLLTGTGTKGITRHKAEVTLVPVIEPLVVLNTCVHGSGPVQITSGGVLTVMGAPVSTNGQLDNDATLDGDAEAQSVGDLVTITGTLTVPAPVKRMPAASVITTYESKATTIPYVGTIEQIVLTPTYNPWGLADPNGLYFLNTGGNDLLLRNARIHGTLIIRAIGRTVTLDDAVFLQNYRSDLPTLLVEGNLHVITHSVEESLSESVNRTNYNPAGAPYEGVYDSDTVDTYPNEIHGLIHLVGDLTLGQTARVVGTILCNGTITCAGTNTIVHDPTFYASPPEGYTSVEGMRVAPGSWRQVVD